MKQLVSTRALGTYLIFLAFYEVAILILGIWGGGTPLLFDPRVGFSWLSFSEHQLSAGTIYFLHSVSAGWLLGLGITTLRTQRLIRIYILSECLLSAPTVFVIGSLLIERGDQFGSPVVVVLPVLVFLFFSAVPVALALTYLHQQRLRS